MVLNKDFKEFLQLLAKFKVKYLVVGGYAVGFHGYPRYTKDLDIWIKPDVDNSANILDVLNEFGFGTAGITLEDLNTEGKFILLGNPPNRIDLITSCEGIEFDECYKNRVNLMIEDTPLNFIDLENLKKNKNAMKRPQDLADLDNLQ